MPGFKFVAADATEGEAEGVLRAENRTQTVTMRRTQRLIPQHPLLFTLNKLITSC